MDSGQRPPPLTFQPSSLGFSLPGLTQQRGHKPECEGIQGDVWELQDLTDSPVQLMGTERWQVLHGQGQHCVIRQVYQHISRCNGGSAGSAGPAT